MTALNTLSFADYTLRPAGESDFELARHWTDADPEHAGRIDPRFWLEQRPGLDSVLLLDALGPVFFCRVALMIETRKEPIDEEPLPLAMRGLSAATKIELRGSRYTVVDRTVAEVWVQFMPCGSEEDRERTRQALERGMEWLEPVLAQSGAEEIFFDSGEEKLIAFCQKRLGFRAEAKRGMRRLRKDLKRARKD